jgi:Na+-transporting NADH:ubiquinone oxidoreductase subunit NqrB
MKRALVFWLVLILLTVNTTTTLATERVVESVQKEHNASLLYVLQWAALIFIFLFSLFYVFKVKRTEHRYEGKWLAYVLTLLVVLAYSLNYHPAIKEYAELPQLGLVKFLVAVANGALLTFYGVLGRHDEHVETQSEVTDSET